MTAEVTSNNEVPDDSPAEQNRLAGFRQSTAACARAIAHDASINIAYDDSASDVDVDSTTLPAIALGATVQQRMETRGRSDAIALYRQFHDNRIHSRLQPTAETSRRCHALAEQTRVELLGSAQYQGVGRNLNAALDKRYRNLYEAASSQVLGDAPGDDLQLGIEHALSLYIREQISGSIPESAQKVLKPWQSWLDNDVKTGL